MVAGAEAFGVAVADCAETGRVKTGKAQASPIRKAAAKTARRAGTRRGRGASNDGSMVQPLLQCGVDLSNRLPVAQLLVQSAGLAVVAGSFFSVSE